MKKFLVPAFVFLTSLGIGWASAPQTAECRQCNSKTCFWDADCGRLCTCVFPGGKGAKRGFCAQVGD
jgi:hypothetical protein